MLLSVVRLISKLSHRPTGDNDPHEPILINLLPVITQIAIKHLASPDSAELVAESLNSFGNLILVPPALQTPEDMDLAVIILPVINRLISSPSATVVDLVEPAMRCLVQVLRRAGSSPSVWFPFYRKLVSFGILIVRHIFI